VGAEAGRWADADNSDDSYNTYNTDHSNDPDDSDHTDDPDDTVNAHDTGNHDSRQGCDGNVCLCPGWDGHQGVERGRVRRIAGRRRCEQ
jgi:hypothetical protein